MKIKKLLSAAFLAAGLAFILPAAALPGRDPGGIPAVMAAEEEPGEAQGWNSDEKGWFYLSEGERLTGLQRIGGDTYYFDEQGYRLTGTVIVGSRLYYFNPATNGKLQTGVTGMQQIGTSGVYYYFLKAANGTVAMNRWANHNGKLYYAGRDGKIIFGTAKIKNDLYHLTAEGRLTSYARSSYNGKYYYARKNGKLFTGLRKIDGKYYYFSPSTGERVSGPVTTDGYTYYFAANGTAKTGWLKRDGKYYYHDAKGRRKTGLTVIDKKIYYLDPADGGARAAKRWVNVSGKVYYFSANGVMATGWLKYAGRTYYLGSDGLRETGMMTISGKKYYFASNGVMLTGWISVGGKTYYLNTSASSSSYGAAVTGWANISGKNYYFDSDAVLQKGIWKYDKSSKAYYYLDKNTGAVLTGKQTINGRVYDLGSTGAYKDDPYAVPSGPKEIRVNRAMNCITVYQGGTPIKAIVCSTAADGVSTPTGTFTLLDKLRWHELNGPSWGQYCSHITWNILFHSVPCKRYQDNHSLNAAEFNKLGQAASGGCIRLTVADAKWIYDNCPVGTKVVIFDDWSSPGPLGKPSAPKIPVTQNYDPTDPYA